MSYTIEQLDCAVKSATEQLVRERDLWKERHDRERAAHAKNLTEQLKVETERNRLRAALESAIDGHKVWESIYGSSPTSRAHLAALEAALNGEHSAEQR